MHKNAIDFCYSVRNRHPDFFVGKKILDVWSMDINWNNKHLFSGWEYTGLDIWVGPNVDIVCPVHELDHPGQYDVVISTEMLEHDKHYKDSIRNMIKLLKPGGLFIVTCAWYGRAEHGTTRTSPADSPYTTDYYANIGLLDVVMFDREEKFSEYEISYKNLDFRFFGIKRIDE